MQPALLGGAGSLDARGSHWLEGFARLKPGVDSRQAEADLTAISAQPAAAQGTCNDQYCRNKQGPFFFVHAVNLVLKLTAFYYLQKHWAIFKMIFL
jgi:hypothetical protein